MGWQLWRRWLGRPAAVGFPTRQDQFNRGVMDNIIRTLVAKPEGLLHLFLCAGVSVEFLACAFETDTHAIESSLREAMRKRDAAAHASLPSSVELIRTARSA